MMLGFNTDTREHNWMYAFNQYLVAKGYIVLSVNYRGGTGYGLDYREADNLGPGGGSELNDVLGAITYLRGRKDVDSHRLGILGDSYGGFLTELGLARASDALAAGVDYAGIYNWSTFLSSVGEPIEGDDANRRAVESSPIATIDQWHSPVLLVKADDDHDVPHQTTELIEDLRSHNIDHDVIVIPNEIHVMVTLLIVDDVVQCGGCVPRSAPRQAERAHSVSRSITAQRWDVPKTASVRYPVHTGLRVSPPKRPTTTGT